MAKSVLELAVGTGQWNSGLKKAQNALNNFTDAQGGFQQALAKDSQKMQAFIGMMGRIDSSAKTSKAQLNDYKSSFDQLTVAFNKLSQAEKNGAIGQTMSKTLDSLRSKINGTRQQIDNMNASMNGGRSTGGGGLFGGSKLGGMLQVFGGNIMTKIAGAGMNFMSEIGDMIRQSRELAVQGEGIRIAFERLNQPGILSNLREATHGTVTDLELMKAAVKFNDFKLPLEELGTMLAFAQQKAKDTGQSVDYMVESIVNGLGRKSKLILDNLGLSAAEIDEKMKETGDMTKAVGLIIREQMSKAGEYIETSADKATKADVKLKNAMESLGNTFKPLADSASDMWSSIKTGALNLLNSAIKPLIDRFTELGRIRRNYERQGGNERVNRQLEFLEGIKTDKYRKGTYKAQLANYDSKIAQYSGYLSDYKKWMVDKTAIGAHDRMENFTNQTGLRLFSDVKEQLEVFKKMRAEYVNGAKEILAQYHAPTPTDPDPDPDPDPTPPGPRDKDIKYAEDSIAAQAALISDLQKKWNEAGASMRDNYLLQLIAAENVMKQMTDHSKVVRFNAENKVQTSPGSLSATGGVTASPVIITGLSAEAMDALAKQNVDNGNGERTTSIQEIGSQISNVSSGIGSLTSGIQQMGLKLPESVTSLINILQGSSSIIQGVLTLLQVTQIPTMTANTAMLAANTAALQANNAMQLIPFMAHGGVLKAASGTVAGSSFSGDNIPALLNAGEVVLNKAETANLANNLQAEGYRNINVSGKIDGTDIILSVDRTLQKQGKGQLLTWG